MTSSAQTRTTLIDTDPGIDDAIAILIALASSRMRVRGITTVAGNIGIETTTRNACRLLALAGQTDIPVHRGAAAPLARLPQHPLDIHGNDGVGGVALPEPVRDAEPLPAVDFLAQILRSEPKGSVDILALGPLTNIAALVQRDQEAAKRVGRVIAMGGAVHEPGNAGPRAEFNMATDPEAAAIVFKAGLPMTLVPLDVTRRVRATREFVSALAGAGSAPASAVAALINAYFASTTGPESRPLHDPCVMLLALDPELFGCRPLTFTVDTGNGGDAGALALAPSDGSPIEVALTVDAERAVAMIAWHFGVDWPAR
jgi:purine nucleosidase